jgi:hypothetical protein
MSDTVKIKRPFFERKNDKGGRVEHDDRGNAVWVRSRSSDTQVPEAPELSLAEEPPAKPKSPLAGPARHKPKLPTR